MTHLSLVIRSPETTTIQYFLLSWVVAVFLEILEGLETDGQDGQEYRKVTI